MPTFSAPGAVLSAPAAGGGIGATLADILVAGADSLSLDSGVFSTAYIENVDATNGALSAVPTAAATYIHLHTASNSTVASVFGSGTVGFKSMEISGGIPSSNPVQAKYEALSAQYRSTAAINQIALTSLSGGKFKVGSHRVGIPNYSRMTILGF